MSENTFSTIVMVYGALQRLFEEFGNTFQQKSLISSAGRKKSTKKVLWSAKWIINMTTKNKLYWRMTVAYPGLLLLTFEVEKKKKKNTYQNPTFLRGQID